MYNVDGFLFEDEATAELAKKEEEGIRFIKERTALDNPEVVFKLYKKLLEQNLFVTPVGVRFMLELQNVLLGSPFIAREEIPPIQVSSLIVKKELTEEEVEAQKKGPVAKVKKVTKKVDEKVEGNYKKPFYVALFFAIVFALSVVGMFVITEISGNNVNILNYRNEILDEYSSWEAELQEKEAELKEWEAELESRDK
ncbi:MAG: hypothetical protein IJ958_07580 [Agathobacter sp.]|nr:hypothetical protein [Agathobacter sp.]